MRKCYQTEWFNIKFNSFTQVSCSEQADEIFYNKFYKEFFKKYNSYDKLPKKWKSDKQELAQYILNNIKNKNKILSIGSGNGFIENEISKNLESQLFAIEPSTNTSHWLKNNDNVKLLNGYFPDILPKESSFDFAYMCYIDYIFDDYTYIKLLQDVKESSIDEFLLLGASVYVPDIKFTIKTLMKNILAYFGLYHHQFWGYQRTIREHIEIFNKIGFSSIDYGQLENGTYWIKVTNE